MRASFPEPTSAPEDSAFASLDCIFRQKRIMFELGKEILHYTNVFFSLKYPAENIQNDPT